MEFESAKKAASVEAWIHLAMLIIAIVMGLTLGHMRSNERMEKFWASMPYPEYGWCQSMPPPYPPGCEAEK